MGILYLCAIIVLSSAVAVIIYALYKNDRNDFLKFYGCSWVFYTLGLLFLLFSYLNGAQVWELLKKLLDMYSILSVLVSVYKYFHRPFPAYWLRFSIYLIVWQLLSLYLTLDALSVALPIVLFDFIMIGDIVILIFKHLDYSYLTRSLASFIFLIWGGIKIYIAISETNFFDIPGFYYIEAVYSNLLFAIVFLFYSISMRSQLDETQNRYKLIVENAQDAFFYISLKPDRTVQYMTPSVQSITGYPPSPSTATITCCCT